VSPVRPAATPPAGRTGDTDPGREEAAVQEQQAEEIGRQRLVLAT